MLAKLRQFGSPVKDFKYGTAGFRDKNNLLDPVLFRVGLIACARSAKVNEAVGVMITASHNAEVDNGVKIVDCNGGMLVESWELIAERIINIRSEELFMSEFDALLIKEGINDLSKGVVIIAMDTRPHSHRLRDITIEGIEMLNGKVHDIGVATTPQLHYAVYRFNNGITPNNLTNDYYDELCTGYNSLIPSGGSKKFPIVVDCANGVGSISIDKFTELLSKTLTIDCRNAAYTGMVNEGCGAEHCQKLQIPPIQMHSRSGIESSLDNQLQCSLDGDADRIVFHMQHKTDESSSWILYDGDKIACIMAQFLRTELQEAGLLQTKDDRDASKFTLGVVQTAYANGASTDFLRSNDIDVLFAKTGVKYCHKLAHDAFDCGIYFEANGHGTVLFSAKLAKAINDTFATLMADDSRKYLAYYRLQASLKLINPVTGDAVSDMLFCIAVLQLNQMDALGWNDIYHGLPSKQTKVTVRDKSLIVCNDNEMQVLSPVALQDALDTIMSTVKRGRCFVRPSGTEDIVRIYAEAETVEGVNALVESATIAINEIVG